MRRLLLLLLVLAPALHAQAETGVAYGPVPATLQGTAASPSDTKLAQEALASLGGQGGSDRAVAMLRMLGDGGLRAAYERLAAGSLDARAKTALLLAAADAEHAAVDTLLTQAAREARPLYRMIAAHGLGRGRSEGAVPPLTTLTNDSVPAVRIAALRSLFAIESDAARAARIAAPVDPVSDLLARRLRWHRRARDAAPGLLAIARTAYLTSQTVDVRMAAAQYLSLPELGAPLELLDLVMREMGGGVFPALFIRLGHGVPYEGYEPLAMRRIAVDTMLNALARTDASPEQRARWIRLAIAWVAHPVPMDPYRRDPIPEHELRRHLPDLGREILAPLTAMLASGSFHEPRQGMIMIRELGADIALPVLRTFLTPRAEAPRYESRAEAWKRRFLRGAAAGAMQEIGRVGDEKLARDLLLGDEPLALKVEIVQALAGDEGPWVVPLLGILLERRLLALRTDAIRVLEQRPEPEARALLVADLFEHGERPHDRLRPLVHRGDEEAVAVMKRGLIDERRSLRKATLSQYHRLRAPRLCKGAGRALLLAHKPRLESEQEIEKYIQALLSVEPLVAVTFVGAQWEGFASDHIRANSLRVLKDTTGDAARHAAMDLALSKTDASSSLALTIAAAEVFGGPRAQYDWTYRPEDIGARLRAMLDSSDDALQREAIGAWTHASAPEAHARLLALLALALDEKALAERESTPEGEQAFARSVIQALRHQPWEAVEATLIDVALAPTSELTTRIVAAQILIGQLREPARQRIANWLGYLETSPEDSPGQRADYILQLFLGAAVGSGADDALAERLLAVLKQALWTYISPARLAQVQDKGPAALRDDSGAWRVKTLARAVGSTRHEPSVSAMLDLVFDPRLAFYANACVRRQSALARSAGPTAAALTSSSVVSLGHNEDGNPNYGMPRAISDIVYETKSLDDAVLAKGLDRVLQAARDDGRLADVPALYMVRVLTTLLDKHTGRKPLAADALWRYARHTGTADGPMHYFLQSLRSTEFADTGRFAEASEAERAMVRAVVRGNLDDKHPGTWLLHRAMQDALAAAAAAAAQDTPRATALFERALARGPKRPDVLNGVAWYRAVVGFDLPQAKREALRATNLEARVENRPSPNAADTLAYILLESGNPQAGLRILGPRMRERSAMTDGLLFFHMAQMYAAAGRLQSAHDALVEALTWDRSLARRVESDRHLKPLLAKISFARLQARAARSRLEQELP